MFSHNAQDLQIKHEPILDETYEPQLYDSPFIKQENPSCLDNSILYAMGNDLLPNNKRLRTEEPGNLTIKRLKTREGLPNFRRPWPTSIKSSSLYSSTNDGNASNSFTNFSISNLIQDKIPKSDEIIHSNRIEKAAPYNSVTPQDNFPYREVNINFIKKEQNLHVSHFKDRAYHEPRTSMSTMISEVQNDLNITNDSDDYENEYINKDSRISKNETNHSFDNEAHKEAGQHNKLNDSKLFWSVQNGNAEQLKLVISKESNTDIPNKAQAEEIITPFYKKQSGVIENKSNTYTNEKSIVLPNKECASEIKDNSQLYHSDGKHLKMETKKENTKTKSNKKSKKKEKRHFEFENQQAILNKENIFMSNSALQVYSTNDETSELSTGKEHRKPKLGKKSKRKEKDIQIKKETLGLTNTIIDKENIFVSRSAKQFYCTNDETSELSPGNEQRKHKSEKKSKRKEKNNQIKKRQPLKLTNIDSNTVGKKNIESSTTQNKEEIKIELGSSLGGPPVRASSILQVSTPLRDIKKNQSSKFVRRYSLPNPSNIKPNLNDSTDHHTNNEKLSHTPRVFMKKIKWSSILQKEKMDTDTKVKIHKMIFSQEDGTTSEIAIKAHLKNLDWSSLGLVPTTMIVEEGAAIANLQGIKGIPYLCGVIIEDPPALVMSYYKGRTLGDYLEEGDTLLALRTFSRACEIVGKIHHRGWAHYDIHADNILGRVNYNNSMTVTLLNFGFCRKTTVNPHHGIYSDSEDLEGHHLPVDIINQKCNGTYVDRYSLCYILEEIISQLKEVQETAEIREVASLGLSTDQPNLRPSSSHLAQLVSKLVSKQTHDTWKLGIDD